MGIYLRGAVIPANTVYSHDIRGIIAADGLQQIEKVQQQTRKTFTMGVDYFRGIG